MSQERFLYAVSVVVPIYNTKEYLAECLDSLEAQTLESLQVILVDDGSTDGSGAIADAYAERRPDRFRAIHQENAGQSAARNAGMALAEGEYLGFFDSDDIALPEMFETMYAAAKERDADHVSCGYQGFAVGANGEHLERPALICGDSRTGEDLYRGVKAGAPQHMWRRAMLVREGLEFPNYLAYEDLSFYLRAIPYVGASANVARPLFQRRWREGSVMTGYSLEKAERRIQVFRDAFAAYRALGLPATYTKLLEGVCVRVLMMSHLASCGQLAAGERGRAVRAVMAFLGHELPYPRRDLDAGGVSGIYLRFCPLWLVPLAARAGARAWRNGA